MSLDPAHCYEAVKSRDPRFDGAFFVGVSTTGVYCRPVCRVRTPGRERCSYFANAAGAEAAGYRPCLRCRPELAPGAGPVAAGERLANAALDRIDSGALATGSVADLARELGVSSRQLLRLVERAYGVGPLALEQTRRLLLAKQLLTDTSLRVIDIAFASGFQSVRQFNRLFREQYRLTPLSLRKQRADAASGSVLLKLGFHPPLAWQALIGFLVARGGARTEKLTDNGYLRTVRLGRHSGHIVARLLGPGLLGVEVAPALLPVLPELRVRLRRLFDLDANPLVIDACLRKKPELRRQLRQHPGLRVPGTLDGFELALRAVLGQRISVKAATTLFGRLVQNFGGEVCTPDPAIDRLVPRAHDLASANAPQLVELGLTRKRAETVVALARAVADRKLVLDPPLDARATRLALERLPGIGPWTAEYIAMRALGDPDAFPHSDLGLLRALSLDDAATLLARAEAFRPWRAYAALHLWQGDLPR